VLTKAGGALAQMALLEDMTLIRDLAVLIVAAAVGGLAAAAARQPVLLGYLAAGALCGPGGLGLIEEMVQVETVAQLGVVFLLFGLGLEFDVRRVRRVRAPALAGTALQLALLGGGGAALAAAAGAPLAAGAFAGAYVTQSSTALVVKCLQEARALTAPHGELMLAALVVQDVLLGVMLSILPAFGDDASGDVVASSDADGAPLGGMMGERGGGGGSGAGAARVVAARAARAAAALAVALGGAALGARHGGPRRALARLASGAGGAEHAQLALCAVCLASALAAHQAGLSLEVGAFAGGLLLCANGRGAAADAAVDSDPREPAPAPSDHVGAHIEPVRNFFGALFLAAVGMTMQVPFLWAHKGVLLLAALGIGAAKAAAICASLLLCGVPRRTAAACGLGLANVGELGFVLLSRARGLGIISRPLFLLLVGTTALSLWATPGVFAAGVRRAARGGGGRADGRGAWGGGALPGAAEEEGSAGYGTGAARAGGGAAGLRARAHAPSGLDLAHQC
jgi:CPA2 family monovalent cation:H+ antiporter-2